jgi:hypothetical protein
LEIAFVYAGFMVFGVREGLTGGFWAVLGVFWGNLFGLIGWFETDVSGRASRDAQL